MTGRWLLDLTGRGKETDLPAVLKETGSRIIRMAARKACIPISIIPLPKPRIGTTKIRVENGGMFGKTAQ
jgi:hypothetical protein